MRRHLAVALDGYLCLLTSGLLIRPYAEPAQAGRAVALMTLPALLFSFTNQVLLTAAVRASAGKLIMGVRVIGLPCAGRPRLSLLVLRWLYGLGRVPLQPWEWLLRSLGGRPSRRDGEPLWSGQGGELYEEMAGLRQVRRRDLLAYRTVAGRAA